MGAAVYLVVFFLIQISVYQPILLLPQSDAPACSSSSRPEAADPAAAAAELADPAEAPAAADLPETLRSPYN